MAEEKLLLEEQGGEIFLSFDDDPEEIISNGATPRRFVNDLLNGPHESYAQNILDQNNVVISIDSEKYGEIHSLILKHQRADSPAEESLSELYLE